MRESVSHELVQNQVAAVPVVRAEQHADGRRRAGARSTGDIIADRGDEEARTCVVAAICIGLGWPDGRVRVGGDGERVVIATGSGAGDRRRGGGGGGVSGGFEGVVGAPDKFYAEGIIASFGICKGLLEIFNVPGEEVVRKEVVSSARSGHE